VVLEKLGKEFVGTVKSLDIMQKITEVGKNLRGKGQTKDLNKRKYLSELYSKRDSLKMELI